MRSAFPIVFVGNALLDRSADEEQDPDERGEDRDDDQAEALFAVALAQLEQAEARKSAKGLVLHSDRWHAGVIGIVASRVVERFHRPTVMVAVKVVAAVRLAASCTVIARLSVTLVPGAVCGLVMA